jgi:cytochrome c-type biogenesis protein CcmE
MLTGRGRNSIAKDEASKMTRKQRRLSLILAGAVVAGFGLWLIARAAMLKDSIAFFNSPTDLAEKHLVPGRRIRLGGLVVNGSIVKSRDLNVRFEVTDGNKAIAVSYQGILPDLFREGQGVVAEGVLEPGGGFKADTVLAKHDERYMPKEVADALKKQGHWQEDYAKKTDAGTRKTP